MINTQRMLCSNQQSWAQVWPFVEHTPPVLCDWLPWNHTFGGNATFNMALRNGGTIYIDGGKPAPGLIETTARNLREIAPTVYFNVPRGFDLPRAISRDRHRAQAIIFLTARCPVLRCCVAAPEPLGSTHRPGGDRRWRAGVDAVGLGRD